jgi:hypothetical protein
MGNFIAFLLTFEEEIEEVIEEEVIEAEVIEAEVIEADESEESLEEEFIEFEFETSESESSEEEEVFEISEVSEEESEEESPEESDEEELSDFEIIIFKKSYSPREVSELIRNNDYYTLLLEFTRITGCSELSCSHCKNRQKKLHLGWIDAIKRKCLKIGINKGMKLPKTCDEQLKANDISNGINNNYYPVLRKLEEKRQPTKHIQISRCRELEKIGIETRPYKEKYLIN